MSGQRSGSVAEDCGPAGPWSWFRCAGTGAAGSGVRSAGSWWVGAVTACLPVGGAGTGLHGEAAQVEPDAVQPDGEGDGDGGEGVAQGEAGQRPGGGPAAGAPYGRGERAGPVALQMDAQVQPLAGLGQPHPVPAVDGEERRDVELLAGRGPVLGVRVEQIAVAFAVRVVHLGHDAERGAVGAAAPVDGERVEDMAEDAGLGEHGDGAVGEVHPPGFQEPAQPGPDGGGGPAEVVPRLEPGQRPQAARQPGRGVRVDEPQVGPVPQRVLAGLGPYVRDGARIQGGPGARVRGSAVAAHHATPRAVAASAPDRQPSSWKPQPWYAPAKAVTGPERAGSRAWADTDSGV